MLDSSSIINLLIVCVFGVGLCFFMAERRVKALTRNRFGLAVIYILELLLCIPAGVYSNQLLFRIVVCASFLFTVFALVSHFLRDTKEPFLEVVQKFSDAMIMVCLIDLAYIVISQITH